MSHLLSSTSLNPKLVDENYGVAGGRTVGLKPSTELQQLEHSLPGLRMHVDLIANATLGGGIWLSFSKTNKTKSNTNANIRTNSILLSFNRMSY
jgi:hypothetical protein